MPKNAAATTAKTKTPGKMTKAEFLVALDEINAALAQQIEVIKQNQREIEANEKALDAKIAATRERLLKL